MNSIGINYKKMEKEREMDELILVNAEDEEIGYGEKAYVHEKGLLHRAFSVFKRRSTGGWKKSWE